MKWMVGAVCAALIVLGPAAAQEVPFAAPPLSGTARTLDSNVEDLGGLMTLIQLRHIKLWYAGQSGNWRLASYEAQRIKENLGLAAILYRNIPIEEVNAAGQALTRLLQSAETKSRPVFTKAFHQLTAGCNSCHAAGGVDFIKIQTPTSSPFTNEAFGPARR